MCRRRKSANGWTIPRDSRDPIRRVPVVSGMDTEPTPRPAMSRATKRQIRILVAIFGDEVLEVAMQALIDMGDDEEWTMPTETIHPPNYVPCSQCGRLFLAPVGAYGYSHCRDHAGYVHASDFLPDGATYGATKGVTR